MKIGKEEIKKRMGRKVQNVKGEGRGREGDKRINV